MAKLLKDITGRSEVLSLHRLQEMLKAWSENKDSATYLQK